MPFWLSYYDVVDYYCHFQARLCPHVRYQPTFGVLADGSFHREASSLIGRLTCGRCIVALGYNGGDRLPAGLRLIDVMLDHVFFLSTCNYGIVQEDHLLCYGKHVEVFSHQLLQSASLNTPRRVSWSLKPAWSAPCVRTSSVKVTDLSKTGIGCIHWD